MQTWLDIYNQHGPNYPLAAENMIKLSVFLAMRPTDRHSIQQRGIICSPL